MPAGVQLKLLHLLALALAGCGPAAPSRQGEALKYWTSANPDEIEFGRRLVEDWNRSNPSRLIEAEPIPASLSSEEVLLASIAGGTTPDLCSNIWPGALELYVEAGGLVRLDDFPDFFDVMLSRMPREVLERFRSRDGHYYQAPWKTNPIMLLYNKRMLREAGIEGPPASYSELLAMGPKLTRDLDGDGQIDQWMGEIDLQPVWHKRMFDFLPFYLAATSGRPLARGSEIFFGTPEAVGVFRLFDQLFRRGYMIRSTSSQFANVFLQELVAIQIKGPWMTAEIERKRPGEMDYGFAPIPLPDGADGLSVTYGDYKNIAIFSTCSDPQAAWDFIKSMISVENDLLLLRVTRQLPVRAGLLEDPPFKSFFDGNPELEPFARQALATRGIDTVPEIKEILDAIAHQFEASAVLGIRPPEEAVQAAVARAERIMQLR